MVTVTPTTVSENAIVGQSTAFYLTLTGGTIYTYTQTFGNICSVSINQNIATVMITPTTSGTLTGSITFNNEATCNITINALEPQPEHGLEPSTETYTMSAQETKNFDFELLGFDSSTETVEYGYTADSSVESALVCTCNPLTNPYGCRLTIEADNQTGQALVGNVYLVADIEDINTTETLRTYTAIINLTIQGSEPTPPSVVTVSPTTVSENGVVGQATSFNLTLTGSDIYTYTQTFGNICNVSIYNDTATVTITPVTSGTLTGSITFNNEATCNITINVTEPAPTGGIQPTTVTTTMEGEDSKDIEYTLLPDTYDISTEDVVYDYESTGSSDFTSKITLSGDIDTETGNYVLTINTQNYSENTVTGTINVYAKIYDLQSSQLLRTYTATVNLTIEPI